MKQLTCEMCGSNDLVKQDGVFVCQSCGCKYSVEEAKKMMVEGTVEVTGTVKVDDSKELTNLYQLARNAKDRKDYKEAAKYYNELLLKEPNSWEANYYTVYAQARDIKVGEIPNEIARVSKNIPTVFGLVKQKYSGAEIVDIIKEIGETFFELTILFFENYTIKIENSFEVRCSLFEAQEDFYIQICNHFADDAEFMNLYGCKLLADKLSGIYVYENKILSEGGYRYYTHDSKNVYRPSNFLKDAIEKANTYCKNAIEKINPELLNEIQQSQSTQQQTIAGQDAATVIAKLIVYAVIVAVVYFIVSNL